MNYNVYNRILHYMEKTAQHIFNDDVFPEITKKIDSIAPSEESLITSTKIGLPSLLTYSLGLSLSDPVRNSIVNDRNARKVLSSFRRYNKSSWGKSPFHNGDILLGTPVDLPKNFSPYSKPPPPTKWTQHPVTVSIPAHKHFSFGGKKISSKKQAITFAPPRSELGKKVMAETRAKNSKVVNTGRGLRALGAIGMLASLIPLVISRKKSYDNPVLDSNMIND